MKLQIPEIPDSWFYVGNSDEISISQKKIFKVHHIEILIYRNESGQLSAIERFCSHMHADLLIGDVIGEDIRCSLHHWCFDRLGKCKNSSSESNLKSYVIKEFWGHIFIFISNSFEFDLPFFSDLDAADSMCSRSYKISTQNDWYIGPANAFDLSHFITVHKRKITREPIINLLNNNGYEIDLDYEILGTSFSDRLMSLLYGKHGGLNFKVFSGNIILATTRVKNFKNYMFIISNPISSGVSEAHLIIFSKKSSNPFKKIKLHIQGWFSQKFFQDEANSFYGIEMHLEKFKKSDETLKNYLLWLEQLFNHR